MKKQVYFIIAIIAIFMAGCGGANKNASEKAKADSLRKEAYEESSALADSISASEAMSSSAAVVSKKDSNRKFVRTADLKFRVKNVYQSTINIENITARNDGFVTYTNLSSNIERVMSTPISADSTLETTFYTVENNIIIRVPNYNLDTTIREISTMIQYLDYRKITADDVSLKLMANSLSQQRLNVNAQRLSNIASDKKNIKSGEAANIAENLYNRQALIDQAKYDRAKLNDEINYSTIKINIYQRQIYKRELVENDKNIKGYEPGFWQKVKEAILFSWDIFLSIILFFIRIWAILLIFVGAFFVIRRWMRKQ